MSHLETWIYIPILHFLSGTILLKMTWFVFVVCKTEKHGDTLWTCDPI